MPRASRRKLAVVQGNRQTHENAAYNRFTPYFEVSRPVCRHPNNRTIQGKDGEAQARGGYQGSCALPSHTGEARQVVEAKYLSIQGK